MNVFDIVPLIVLDDEFLLLVFHELVELVEVEGIGGVFFILYYRISSGLGQHFFDLRDRLLIL